MKKTGHARFLYLKITGLLFGFGLLISTPTSAAVIYSTPISCDGDVSGSISINGEIDEFTFDGVAETRVIIRMQGSGLLDPLIELIGPNGSLLISDVNTSDGLARIGDPLFVLPFTGPYTIRVSDYGNNNTGDYGLSLQFLSTECATPIACDADLTGQFTRMAQMTAHYFTGTLGQRIIIRMQGASLLDPAIELYGPNGVVEFSTNTSDGLARVGDPVYTLPYNGTYFIVISDDEGSNFSDYGLSIQFLETSCATSIACDADLTGQFTRMAQMTAHYFNGILGQRIIIRMQGTGLLDPAIELYGPQGLVKTSINTSDGLARIGDPVYTLPYDGIYFIVISDDEGSNFSDYGLSIQFLETSCATPIACDADLTGQFTRMAQMTAHYFTGIQGQRIIIRMQGASLLDPAIELYGPNGVVEFSTNTSDGLARIGDPVYTLPYDGIYFIVISDDEGSNFSDYGLSIQFLETSCATPITCNADLSSQFTRMAQMTAHYFTGIQGQRIIIRMQGAGLLDPAIELYGPNDIVESSINTSDGLARLGDPVYTLPYDGIYFIIISDDEGSNFSDYGLSIQFLETSCATPIACDADLTGQFTRMAQMTAHYFTGIQGQRIIIRMQGASLLDPAIELYGPNGVVEFSTNTSDGLARIGDPVYTLPYDGIYFIVISDDEGSNFSDYGLSVQFLETNCATPISCDADLTAAFTHMAQMTAHYFTGIQGQRIIIRMQGAGLLDPAIELFGPNEIFESSLNSSDGLARIGDPVYALPSDGTYFIVISDDEGSNFDDYGLSIQFLETSCAAPIACDANLTGNITNLAGMHAWTLAGQPNDRMMLQIGSLDFLLEASLEIYDASGNLLHTVSATANEVARLDNYILEGPFPYYFVLMEKDGDRTGSYNLSIQLLSTVCSVGMDCDGDAAASISGMAQMKGFSFTAAQGEKVLISLQETGSQFEPEIKIYRSGDTNFEETIDTDGNYRSVYQAPATDTFFLVIRDQSGRRTGDFGLSIQSLNPACSASFGCNQDTSATISLRAETHAFQIDPGPNQHILLRGYSQAVQLAMEIYNPAGDLLTTLEPSTGSGKIETLWTAPAYPGPFLVLLRDKTGAKTGSYGFSCQFIDGACADGQLDCSAPILGNISKPGEVDAYRVHLANGQRIVLRAISNSGIDLQLEWYDLDTGNSLGGPSDVNAQLKLDRKSTKDENLMLVIKEREGDETGAYKLFTQIIGSEPACGTELYCLNDAIVDQIASQGEMRMLYFQADPGDRGIIRLAKDNNNLTLKSELYDDKNNLVGSNLSRYDFNVNSNTQPGFYTLLIWDQAGVNTGGVAVAFQRTNDHSCGEPIGYNSNELITLNRPAAMYAFLVQADEGDVLIAQTRGAAATFDAAIEVYNDQGQQLDADIAPNGLARIDPLKIIGTGGTIKIIIMENEGDETGSLGFSLQKVNPGLGDPLPLGGTVIESLNYPASSQSHVVEGLKGEKLSFEVQGITPELTPRVELYRPDGTLAKPVQEGNLVQITDFSIPENGSYTILVMDNNGRETGSYRIGNLLLVATTDTRKPGIPLQVYPNPFSERVTIRFALQRKAGVTGRFYNDTGSLIATIDLGKKNAGTHDLEWAPGSIPAGVYFYQLTAGGQVYTGRVIRQKD